MQGGGGPGETFTARGGVRMTEVGTVVIEAFVKTEREMGISIEARNGIRATLWFPAPPAVNNTDIPNGGQTVEGAKSGGRQPPHTKVVVKK